MSRRPPSSSWPTPYAPAAAGPAPGSRAQRLRQAVARDEAQLQADLHTLQRRVEAKADIRRTIVNRPYAWLAGSFLLGLWWGASKKG